MTKTKFPSLTASLALATTLTLSCGEHGFSDLLDTSSSSEGAQGGSSSSIAVSSSGNERSSSSTELSSSSVPSSSSLDGGYSSSYDSITYEGQTYRTVVIGTQTWFAENLNYAAEGSLCYGYEEENCAKYGRLYDWTTAKQACPTGWHLPSNDDWDKLFRYVDYENDGSGTEGYFYDSYTAGKYLKATDGWNDNEGKSGNGTDEFEFSALPGGYGDEDGIFRLVGNYGYWWSASEDDSEYGNDNAYSRRMFHDQDHALWYPDYKPNLYSVRCIKD